MVSIPLVTVAVHLGKHLPKLGGGELVLEGPVRILDEEFIKFRVQPLSDPQPPSWRRGR